MAEPTNELTRLEGEDVCVCTPPYADDDILFVLTKINEAGATAIVALFDSDSADGEKVALSFIGNVRAYLPEISVRRKFAVFSRNEWDRFTEVHQGEAYSVFQIGERESAPAQVADDAVCGNSVKAFASFNDIPGVKRRLLQIVNLFSGGRIGPLLPIALLIGETGTGKSFAAKAIYDALTRNGPKGRFVQLNCALFGAEDMNAALFGVAKGAFTGTMPRKGAIEDAAGGVLFLDEIGTLPLSLQSRLLTVLDGGEYYRHGSTDAPKKSNCCFIFGTNNNLEKDVASGKFRIDLYFRICGIRVRLPSLAERIGGQQGDLFLDKVISDFCNIFGGISLTRYARTIFIEFAKSHEWRGNFRTLQWLFRNVVMEMRMSDSGKVASAEVMRAAIEALVDEQVNGLETSCQPACATSAHPLLRSRADISMDDKRMLESAFRCAAEATNSAEAGRRFFAELAGSNPSLKFKRLLDKYGFRFEIESVGHIRALDVHAS